LPTGLKVLVFLSALLLLVSGSNHAGAVSTVNPTPPDPAGALPATGQDGQPSSVQADYDEQLGISFSQGFRALAYNVTAVAQSDENGFGPGYLLNGLTNGGYWYQVGLAYDWPYQSGGYNAGFNSLYEVFNSSKASIFPPEGGGGLSPFSGPVNDGDKVLLKLYFVGGEVNFLVHDWNTSASVVESFTAVGDSFIGLHSQANPNGFFSGLMTEWYHADLYFGAEGKVTYSNPSTPLLSATLWADEFNSNTSASVFGYSQPYTFMDPSQLRILSLDGATEYADAYIFITGPLNTAILTLSYSISGGGTGYSPPTLSYVLNGMEQIANISETPKTFFADNGSSWQVSSTLAGGTSSERWETNQPTAGTVTSSHSEALLYFHQYLVSFAYSIKGGGSGYASPQTQSTEFGSPQMQAGNGSAWVDADTTFSYPASLAGSSSGERWASLDYSWTASGTQTIIITTYYHQYGLAIGYRVVGGGSESAPLLSGTQFGASYSVEVTNSTTYYLDAESAWSLPSLLQGSGSTERWYASQGVNGTATGPATETVTYHRQFTITSVATPAEGGTANLTSAWSDAGTTVEIFATANQGWKFVGWTGTGSGSFSGPSNTATVVVTGPVAEDAKFFLGVTVDAGSGGSVRYASPTGNGTLAQGGSTIIYLPKGSTLTLQATPSSPIYSFSGWGSSGSGSGALLSTTVGSPETISATFTLSPLIVGLAIVALVGVVTALVVAMRGRRRPPTPSPSL